MDFGWPGSRPEIERIQHERKRIAVELASSVPFYRNRLAGIDRERLHDPEVWTRIPR